CEDAVAREQRTREVHRIDGAHRDARAVVRLAAHLAEERDGLRQRELLARHADDEAPASDHAARFEAAQGAHHVAPRDRVRLPQREVAEDDAVPGEEHVRDRLGDLVLELVAPLGDGGPAHQRPPAGWSATGEHAASEVVAASTRRATTVPVAGATAPGDLA